MELPKGVSMMLKGLGIDVKKVDEAIAQLANIASAYAKEQKEINARLARIEKHLGIETGQVLSIEQGKVGHG